MTPDSSRGLLPSWLAVGAVALGLAMRLFFASRGMTNSDEAIVGLMGMEILKGHHFAFYWGQAYMGSLEAYAAALLFLALGATPFVLKLVPLIFFLAAAWLHHRYAARLLGEGGGRILLVLLFVSPAVFASWTWAPRGGYMEALALGGAALLLGDTVARRPRPGTGILLLLGLVGGLGFWTNFLFVYYLVPLGLLVILPACRRGGWLRGLGAAGGGFLLGSSPAWIWNLLHDFASLHMADRVQEPAMGRNLFNLLARQLPTVLGADKLTSARGAFPDPVNTLLLAVWGVAAILFPVLLLRRARDGRGAPAASALLPAAVVATALALFLATGFGGFNTQRYLIPVYPLAAMAMAAFLAAVGGRNRWVALSLGSFVVGASLWGWWDLYEAKILRGLPEYRSTTLDLVNACREEGVRTAWAGHWESYLVTFLSREEVIVGDVELDRYEPFQKLVAAAPDPSLITSGKGAEVTATLEANGLGVRDLVFGSRHLFVRPLPRPEIGRTSGRVEVPPGETSGGRFGPSPGGGVVSETFQRKGMAVTFDLGGARTVNGLILSPGEFTADYPESFTVETSRDGATWEPAASAEQYLGGLYHMDRLRWARDGMVSAHFPPREASRVRVSLLHRREDRRWSVARAWVELAGG